MSTKSTSNVYNRFDEFQHDFDQNYIRNRRTYRGNRHITLMSPILFIQDTKCGKHYPTIVWLRRLGLKLVCEFSKSFPCLRLVLQFTFKFRARTYLIGRTVWI